MGAAFSHKPNHWRANYVGRRIGLGRFDDKQQADLAIHELNRAGFPPEQIAVARQFTTEEMRKAEAAKEHGDGAVAGLASFFSNLLGLGTEEDNGHEEAFRARRTIVRIMAGERNEEAMEILLRDGGHNRVSRPRMNEQNIMAH